MIFYQFGYNLQGWSVLSLRSWNSKIWEKFVAILYNFMFIGYVGSVTIFLSNSRRQLKDKMFQISKVLCIQWNNWIFAINVSAFAAIKFFSWLPIKCAKSWYVGCQWKLASLCKNLKVKMQRWIWNESFGCNVHISFKQALIFTKTHTSYRIHVPVWYRVLRTSGGTPTNHIRIPATPPARVTVEGEVPYFWISDS